ncbi:class I SAM-dependent methyltransferase [Salinarimonas rosea]|uniref:class I SAM-dependent methyltransferase n=1 Tax=Salinarimonas rosea TaxID=552063 RepID=UPI00041D4E56|nr:class I SAM-dependent methyltransferase [Salinarimonas rosea]
MPAFKDHFSGTSADYARCRPTYPPELARMLADVSPATGLALDVGCGSGQLTALLAERFERVVGVDASAEQIARATAHPRIAYRCAPAEATGVAPGTADLVVAAQAAHWFALDAFYAEARRVARPGAAIALVTYATLDLPEDAAADAVVRDFYGNVAGPYWPAERAHVEAGYASLPFPFPEIAYEPLAIRVRWPLEAFLGYVATWSALAGLRRAQGEAPIEVFRERLAQAWGDPSEPKAVCWPIALRLGRLP